jgi:soluble lytic murein transglycosylase-like protein
MIRHIMIMVLFVIVVLQSINLSATIHPISTIPENINPLQQAAVKAGIKVPCQKILNAVTLASKQTNLSESFLLSLMYSESSFDPKVISSKGYCGLMQIPERIFDYRVNTMRGADIFVEKLTQTKGDYFKALILYKGWELSHPKGQQKAKEVLVLARKLKEG